MIACPDAKFKNATDGLEYSERAFISNRSSYKTRLSAGKKLATAYIYLGDKTKAVTYINKAIALARQENMGDEYNSYFRKLTAKK